MDKILIIDDDEDKRSLIADLLRKEMGEAKVEIVAINDKLLVELTQKSPEEGANNSAEKRLERYLTNSSEIKLIVVDHDLSGYNSALLSESVISDACKLSGVPHCRYSRVMSKTTQRQKIKELVQRTHLYSAKVDLQGLANQDFANPPEDIVRIHSIFIGFNQLRENIEQLEVADSGQSGWLRTDIVKLAAGILNKESMESVLSGYAKSFNLYGDYVELLEAIESQELTGSEKYEKYKKNLTYLIGFWLYNSVLKFPGVILKTEAAASYLNLDCEDFKKHKEFFDSALYSGPFSDKVDYDFWWRFELDDILIESDADSGYELLKAKGIKDVRSSECMKCKEPAGYFCLVNEKPICKKHSLGSLEWMPHGADLSRIAKDDYELYQPHFQSNNS